jgi:Calcineurin-like phosphoesterase
MVYLPFETSLSLVQGKPISSKKASCNESTVDRVVEKKKNRPRIENDDNEVRDDRRMSAVKDIFSSRNRKYSFYLKVVQQVTTFYAVGDVPYSDLQHYELQEQILAIPSDAEFVIHVGDMRHAGSNAKCTLKQYTDVSKTLQLSKVPVFIILGDNDWNDCPNPSDGLKFWRSTFSNFTTRYWPNHNFTISSQTSVSYNNFAFVHKGALYIGLNIVGGKIIDKVEWDRRLSSQATWVISLINSTVHQLKPSRPRVVLFGHADPKPAHDTFFLSLKTYIQGTLLNSVAILYVCGDAHKWKYQTKFYNQTSFTRITLTGTTKDPPLQLKVNATGLNWNLSNAFLHNRRLSASQLRLDAISQNNDETDDIYNEYKNGDDD